MATRCCWPVVCPLVQPDVIQQLVRPLAGWPARNPGQPQRNHDVGPGAETGDEVERLEDHPDGFAPVGGQGPSAQRGDVLLAEADRARRGLEQPGQAGQQRGLAAAGGAEQDNQLAVLA
jgi:hypothetical protein